MSCFDDLPKRDVNHRIQEQSEIAFRNAISGSDPFVVQSEDRYDYGTDFQIEASDAGVMTNVRVHVQLKGTLKEKNSDGIVAVSIERKNLNYLAMPPGSVFVCYHMPSKQMLVRRVDDVIREYEHGGKSWNNQATVTVRFEEEFDERFQEALKKYAIACAKGARDHRIDFATLPPEHLSTFIEERAVDLPVPADPRRAEEILVELYERGHDGTISQSFDKFLAVLGPSNAKFMIAYMAEINLGINGRKCDKSRIEDGINVIHGAVHGSEFSPGTLQYCVGNGWSAIGEYEKAKNAYQLALDLLDDAEGAQVAARCYKNLGAAMEKLNSRDEAHDFYTRALELDPALGEAHFSLGLWHLRISGNLDHALDHLDAIVWTTGATERLASVQYWRAEIFFRQGKISEAFREIRALLGQGDAQSWVWPSCARLVGTHGKASMDAARSSVQFWDAYLTRFEGRLLAQRERLLCIWRIRSNGGRTEYDYDAFKQEILLLIARGAPDPAFLWDRTGHWAQDDNNWSEAEECYRKAFELSPGEYGYCLGTALNFRDKYDEALPILLAQAEEHLPDALSWFQVAVARGNSGDIEGCINAYERALELDEDYDLAWFNLGGAYWNSKKPAEAMEVWREAMRRFPQHELASEVRRAILGMPDDLG